MKPYLIDNEHSLPGIGIKPPPVKIAQKSDLQPLFRGLFLKQATAVGRYTGRCQISFPVADTEQLKSTGLLRDREKAELSLWTIPRAIAPVRIIVVDDSPLYRAAISAIIHKEPSLEVVAEAENGLVAIAAVKKHRPDVVLMDISMPVLDGFTAIRTIKSRCPESQNSSSFRCMIRPSIQKKIAKPAHSLTRQGKPIASNRPRHHDRGT